MNVPVKDKYSAVWVSHTSINDFLVCPRAYYLKNVYKDPKTRHKIKLMSPPLALGQIVHEVVESLSTLPLEERFNISLIEKLHLLWVKVSGKKGGFMSQETEELYKKRGEEMLLRLQKNPGPLERLAVKIKMNLPYFWLSEEDNIILCGKIDWLEYLKDTDSVHIIDFKTSKHDEEASSLQLPIYYLLATHCQHRHVSKVSYWYLERSIEPQEEELPHEAESHHTILEIAKRIKLARQLERFKCPHTNGCRSCRPYEAIIRGEAEFVGLNAYKENVYILDKSKEKEKESEIL